MFLTSFLAGIALGIFYFTALWWTVRKLPDLESGIYLWVSASFLFRAGVVVTGFYLVMAGDWVRMVFCLAGFMTVRLFSVRRVKRGDVLSVR
jgi:F1F0 ATPase subunit 2